MVAHDRDLYQSTTGTERVVQVGTEPEADIQVVEVEPDAEALFEEYCARGWCDGYPFIPPTAERVSRMLTYTDRDPDDVIGQVPPNLSRATVQKIAINAVMAGCRPEYLPVVITALDALLQPEANLRGGLTTTYSSWPIVVVNGPVRLELGINCSWGVLANSGFRPNATIGRALTLIFMNIGGARPGVTEKKPQGSMMRYTPVIGEFEEESGWEPLHVERGYARDVSAVTVFADNGMPQFIYGQAFGHPTYELYRFALGMASITHPHPMIGGLGCNPLLLFNPNHTQELAADGWTKDDVKRFLYENARNRREQLLSSPHNPLVPEDIRKNTQIILTEGQSKWSREFMESPYVTHPWVPIVKRPEDFIVVVAGYPAPQGGKLLFFPGHSMREQAVTRPITRRDGTPIKSIQELRR